MEHNPGDNIAVSLSGDDGDELRSYWERLSDGGTVSIPLEKQTWGDEFGACVDQFGISYMVNIGQPQADPPFLRPGHQGHGTTYRSGTSIRLSAHSPTSIGESDDAIRVVHRRRRADPAVDRIQRQRHQQFRFVPYS
jgi:hypothetical protein